MPDEPFSPHDVHTYIPSGSVRCLPSNVHRGLPARNLPSEIVFVSGSNAARNISMSNAAASAGLAAEVDTIEAIRREAMAVLDESRLADDFGGVEAARKGV